MKKYTKILDKHAIELLLADNTTKRITDTDPMFPAIRQLNQLEEKETEKPVIIQDWSPAECPTCGNLLSESLGDGYYRHRYGLERCPRCNQLLGWAD